MKIDINEIKINSEKRHRKDMGDLEGLAYSIKEQGLLQPIGLNKDNVLVFGERRLKACRDVLGWESIEYKAVDVTSIVEGELAENEVRKNFTPSERVAIGKAIEKLLGCRQGKRTDLEHSVNSPEVKGRETRDIAAEKAGFGSESTYREAKQAVEHGAPEVVNSMDNGETSIHKAATISKLPKNEQAEAINKPHVTHNSGNNEWYTPSDIIERAREVFGGTIDLDPASCEAANKVVQAEEYYDQDIDGLTQLWGGCVWMNPPYGQGLVTKFVDKFLVEFGSGNIKAGIVLVNNATETGWFQRLGGESDLICFPKGRLKFWGNGDTNTGLQGQAILYFGEKWEDFGNAFADVGLILGEP